MKKLVALLFLLPFGLWAQPPVDEMIEAAIGERNSPYYYPTLMYRYSKGDSSLTVHDYRHLYYGYVFSPDYDPYVSPPELDSILMVFEKNPDPGLDQLGRLVRFGNRVLESQPFNIRVLNILTFAWGTLGDEDKEFEYYYKTKMIVEAILSSGLGSKEDSPWHVIYFSHTGDVMDYLNYPYLKRVAVSRTVEYLPLMKKQGEIKGFYFDFGRVFTAPYTREKKDRGWEINGMKIR